MSNGLIMRECLLEDRVRSDEKSGMVLSHVAVGLFYDFFDDFEGHSAKYNGEEIFNISQPSATQGRKGEYRICTEDTRTGASHEYIVTGDDLIEIG